MFRASDTVTWHASSAETADGLIHAIPETVVEALADFVAAEDWKPLRYHLETEATAFFERVFEEPKSEYALSMDKVRNRRPSSEDLVVMTFDPRYRVISGRRGEPESRSDHLFLETWLTLRFFLVHREEDNAQFDRCELLFEDRALSEIRVPRHAWTRKDTLVLAQLVKDGTTKAFNSLRKVVGRSALLVSEPGTSVLDLKVRNDLLLRPHSGMKEGGQ